MEFEEEKLQMVNQEKAKCARIPCLCDVALGQEYCSEACRDAGSEEVEIACQWPRELPSNGIERGIRE
jgi:hypothetical protein